MDYDEISELSEGNMAFNSRFYEIYIAPLLQQKPNDGMYKFLLSHADEAWRLGIDRKDLKLVKFVENICQNLQKENENNLAKLFSSVIDEQHDTAVKTRSADRSLWEAKRDENFESVINSLLEIYKVYFENEFRLWSSVIYYYVCQRYKIKTRASNLESFVYVGASEKFQAIKNIKVSFGGGNPKDLVKGFDNQIRNCGAGHDRWEILDNNNILLNKIKSESGEKKGEIEITKEQLEEYVKLCRKSIWILKTGIIIFSINNPDFGKKLEEKKIKKVSAIEEEAREFAKNRLFRIKEFEINQNRTELKLAVKYEKQVIPKESQIFLGGGEAYDILYVEEDSWFHFHILDIMQYILLQLDKKQLPNVVYDMYDEEDKLLAHVEFDNVELQKIFTSKDRYMPKAKVGEIPKKQITISAPIRVPYGSVKKIFGTNTMKKEVFENFLKRYKK